jgi:hypothetical protein
MADYRLGMNAKAYFENAATGLVNLDELPNVKDVTLTMEAADADITTRANSGWRARVAALREGSAEFEMVWKDTDTGFDALQDAFLNGTVLEMAFLTGAKSSDGVTPVVGSDGLYGEWSVTSFPVNQPLEEAITVPVTVMLTTFKEWITDGLQTVS